MGIHIRRYILMSLSVRRAWIEIVIDGTPDMLLMVALREEGVD